MGHAWEKTTFTRTHMAYVQSSLRICAVLHWHSSAYTILIPLRLLTIRRAETLLTCRYRKEIWIFAFRKRNLKRWFTQGFKNPQLKIPNCLLLFCVYILMLRWFLLGSILCQLITKIRLYKYIVNFTAERTKILRWKIVIFFLFLLKI